MKLEKNGTFKNVAGIRFGMLVVIECAGSNADARALWRCQCDCGKETTVSGKNLRQGHTQSCGCLHLRIIKSGNNTRTHGHTSNGKFTKEYMAWCGAKRRCFCRKAVGFKNYGGRGITMCDRWKHSFESFLKDMGPCPKGMSLDRKDNEGNYEPRNCRWATRSQQNNNQRRNHRISFNGETLTMSEWAFRVGVSQGVIWKRIVRDGWSLERALSK